MQNPVKAEGSLWTRGYPSHSLGLTDENGVIKQRDHIGRSKNLQSALISPSCWSWIMNWRQTSPAFASPWLHTVRRWSWFLCLAYSQPQEKSQDQVFLGRISAMCACVGTWWHPLLISFFFPQHAGRIFASKKGKWIDLLFSLFTTLETERI